MSKTKATIISAETPSEAALNVMVGSWNKSTAELIRSTFKLTQSSEKTSVFTSVWNTSEVDFIADSLITAYVQVYDAELGLYLVHSEF